MPRSKTLSDRDVLAVSHKLIHERGPEALTFESLARACGLSAATLVQRFKSKAGLKQSTLLLCLGSAGREDRDARGHDSKDRRRRNQSC